MNDSAQKNINVTFTQARWWGAFTRTIWAPVTPAVGGPTASTVRPFASPVLSRSSPLFALPCFVVIFLVPFPCICNESSKRRRVEHEGEKHRKQNLRQQLVSLELKTEQIHFKGELLLFLQRFAVSCCYWLLAVGMSASSQIEPNQMLKLDPETVT